MKIVLNFVKIQALIAIAFVAVAALRIVPSYAADSFCQGYTCAEVEKRHKVSIDMNPKLGKEIRQLAHTKDRIYSIVQNRAAEMGVSSNLDRADGWYAHNIAAMGMCSPYFNDELPRFDSFSYAPRTETIEDDIVYINDMWRLAREVSSAMWGNKKVPLQGFGDYVDKYFDAAMCCQPGTYNRVAYGFDNGACMPCGKGFYCEGGSARLPCPFGTYTITEKSAAASDCVYCPDGFFCFDPAKTEPCPAGSWSIPLAKLADKLDEFFKSRGYNPNRTEFLMLACSAGCPEGHYCSGDGTKTICPAGSICQEGSSNPSNFCPAGTWSNPGAKSASDCKAALCPEGFHCANGRALNCGAGFFYNVPASPSTLRTKDNVCRTCQEMRPFEAGFNFYCPDGINKVACPLGHFADTAGRPGNLSDCVKCAAGFVCPEGGANIFACAEGSYCPDGKASEFCPVGKWSSNGSVVFDNWLIAAKAPGAAKASDCWNCPAGRWCEGGLQFACPVGSYCAGDGTIKECPSGTFCAGGNVAPVPCAPGTWSHAGTKEGCLAELCGAGQWCDANWCADAGVPINLCENKSKAECPAGSYCAGDGEIRECPAGSYCPVGSVQKNVCPDGTWSPAGSAAKVDCTGARCGNANYWCDGTKPNIQPCAAGFLCARSGVDFGQVVIKTECAAGKYCPEGQGEKNCPVGTWSSVGAKSVGDCRPAICGAGNWCDGNGSRTECPLGKYCAGDGQLRDCTPGNYCAGGSIAPKNCPEGQWSADGASACSVSDCNLNLVQAGKQNWCSNGNKVSCPAGFFCPGDGTKLDCPAGSYCAAGSRQPNDGNYSLCPVGTWSYRNASAASDCKASLCGETEYCVAGSKNPCAAGSFCPDEGLIQGCLVGGYCPENVRATIPCAPGTWAPANSASAAACTSAVCGAGFWCEMFSRTACPAGRQCPGDGRNLICPEGSFCAGGTTTNCPAGTWSPAGSSNISACDKDLCGAGNSCAGGVKQICPAGSYCALGAGAATCANGFCPAGSAAPLACLAGTFANGITGLTAAEDCAVCPDGKWGANCAADCPAGFVCGGGRMDACGNGNVCPLGTAPATIQKCPAGTFGVASTIGAAAECSACPSGTWSDAGTADASGCAAEICGAGFWCDGNKNKGACAAGFFCPGDGERHACGLGRYCPQSSDAPSLCPAGTIGTITNATIATQCVAASGSNWQPAPGQNVWEICPQTYYVSNNGTECVRCEDGNRCEGSGQSVACTGTTWSERGAEVCYVCPPGFKCNNGIKEPCAPGTYSLGNANVCTTCEAGYYCPGSTGRIDCPIGRWCPATGMWIHVECGAGAAAGQAAVAAIAPKSPAAGRVCGTIRTTNPPLCPVGSWVQVEQKDMTPSGAIKGDFASDCELCWGMPRNPGYYCPDGAVQIQNAGITCPINAQGLASEQAMVVNSICGAYPNAANWEPLWSAFNDYAQFGHAAGMGLVAPMSGARTSVSDTITGGTACANGYFSKLDSVVFTTTNTLVANYSCIQATAGYFYDPTKPYVEICPVGHYCPAGTRNPIQCPAGTWRPVNGGAALADCWECPMGAYCAGGAAKASCPVGQLSRPGSDAATACRAPFLFQLNSGSDMIFSFNVVSDVRDIAVLWDISVLGTAANVMTTQPDRYQDSTGATLTFSTAYPSANASYTAAIVGLAYNSAATGNQKGVDFNGNAKLTAVNVGGMGIAAADNEYLRLFPSTAFNSGVPYSRNGFLSDLFQFTKITSLPANFLSGVSGKQAGNFMYQALRYTNLTGLPTNFLSGVSGMDAGASGFMSNAFEAISTLTTLPAGFLSGITGAQGGSFLSYAFNGDANLSGINSDFLQNISGAQGGFFLYQGFNGAALSSLPSGLFNNISGQQGDNFLGMFLNNNRNMTSTPNNFLPRVSGAQGTRFLFKAFDASPNLTKISLGSYAMTAPTGTSMFENTFETTGNNKGVWLWWKESVAAPSTNSMGMPDASVAVVNVAANRVHGYRASGNWSNISKQKFRPFICSEIETPASGVPAYPIATLQGIVGDTGGATYIAAKNVGYCINCPAGAFFNLKDSYINSSSACQACPSGTWQDAANSWGSGDVVGGGALGAGAVDIIAGGGAGSSGSPGTNGNGVGGTGCRGCPAWFSTEERDNRQPGGYFISGFPFTDISGPVGAAAKTSCKKKRAYYDTEGGGYQVCVHDGSSGDTDASYSQNCAKTTEFCAAGYVKKTAATLPYNGVAADVCEPCPAGTFATISGNTTTCTPCAAGTYNDLVGQAECKECPCGKACVGTGNTAAATCPTGVVCIGGTSSTTWSDATARDMPNLKNLHFCPGGAVPDTAVFYGNRGTGNDYYQYNPGACSCKAVEEGYQKYGNDWSGMTSYYLNSCGKPYGSYGDFGYYTCPAGSGLPDTTGRPELETEIIRNGYSYKVNAPSAMDSLFQKALNKEVAWDGILQNHSAIRYAYLSSYLNGSTCSDNGHGSGRCYWGNSGDNQVYIGDYGSVMPVWDTATQGYKLVDVLGRKPESGTSYNAVLNYNFTGAFYDAGYLMNLTNNYRLYNAYAIVGNEECPQVIKAAITAAGGDVGKLRCGRNFYGDLVPTGVRTGCPSGLCCSNATARACPAGYATCTTKEFQPSGSDCNGCTACAVGTICPGGTAKPYGCPAGTRGNKLGGTDMTACTTCEAGTFNPNVGWGSCTSTPEVTSYFPGATCPSGWTRNSYDEIVNESYCYYKTQSTSDRKSFICPDGWGKSSSGWSCDKSGCGDGQWRNGQNCAACPSNATCDGVNFQCNANAHRVGNQCIACTANQYFTGSACAACPSNATCANDYIKCNDGYMDNSTRTGCVACMEGATCAGGNWTCNAGWFDVAGTTANVCRGLSSGKCYRCSSYTSNPKTHNGGNEDWNQRSDPGLINTWNLAYYEPYHECKAENIRSDCNITFTSCKPGFTADYIYNANSGQVLFTRTSPSNAEYLGYNYQGGSTRKVFECVPNYCGTNQFRGFDGVCRTCGANATCDGTFMRCESGYQIQAGTNVCVWHP